MIRGVVNATYEAVVRIRVRGPGGVEADVDAVFDSGFSDLLTLPVATIVALGLVRHSRGRAILADGSIQQYDLYTAEVFWGTVWQTVRVPALGDEALLGMRLLAGHELRIEVVPGGVVAITPLP